MSDRNCRRPGFCAGIVLGSVLAILAVRFGAGHDATNDRALDLSHFVPVHATATDSNESFTTATGSIDEDVEGIFFLDPITGELSCWVMNIYSGKFSAVFRYNDVVKDVEMRKAKNSRLLMVTGRMNYKAATQALRPSDTVVYVVNSATGHFAAYAVPWNKTIAREKKYTGELRLLDKGRVRTKAVAPLQ